MKSDIEVVIEYSRTLEGMLERNFGAKGRGLHEKIQSVSSELTQAIIRKLRFIASVRNQVVHQEEHLTTDKRARLATAFATCCDALSLADIAPAEQNGRAKFRPFKTQSAAYSADVARSRGRRPFRAWIQGCDRFSNAGGPVICVLVGSCTFLTAAYYRSHLWLGLACTGLGLYLGWKLRVYFGRALALVACGFSGWLLVTLLRSIDSR